jgi:hypothetical protein
MFSWLYPLAVLFIIICYVIYIINPLPKPPNNEDDEGGDPIDNGLPDLDLPPGISRPLNDWEPDYKLRTPRKPALPEK